ncbi:hypothetical protein BV20DRAFT_37080 [Pilatotrama ljubarskyi]|nr:hypothetical protein BV20DRAFT_37080 [Pilatotrama ljubarskyi]
MPWASSQCAVQRPRRAFSRGIGWAYRRLSFSSLVVRLISLWHILYSLLYACSVSIACAAINVAAKARGRRTLDRQGHHRASQVPSLVHLGCTDVLSDRSRRLDTGRQSILLMALKRYMQATRSFRQYNGKYRGS